MSRICVYLGSREGNSPGFRLATNALGRALAARGHTLVYGGARLGLMGELANAALEAGGDVIGVMPDHLVDREQAHFGLSELIRVRNMHERKATMAANADAFIALPGGIGTFEELFETWTWGYLGLHTKPMGLLNIDEFYSPLLTFLDSTVGHGFLASATRDMLLDAATPNELLDALEEQL
ncbi:MULTISPECIES: LOG family protein [Halomonas]|uniref:Cytokinin riboside 5'-monophosphate phosphoribohydrolase n=1 Tax=Halomonas casei TaxID=2742613 RepID=A0ABR9F705_9GAMM|nr:MULTISPECIES: TIGR00730 family Rossman fold protein [Halomonas]MBE0401557.1 TIGR00730 family Rossman fold protein [Halomonas casei]PCC20642.1 TIGR00730 family Rossman fold protein [Halomonas sp. JB37]